MLSLSAEGAWDGLTFAWEVRSRRIIGAPATNDVNLHTHESLQSLKARLAVEAGREAPLPLLAVLPTNRAPRVDLDQFKLPTVTADGSKSAERLARWREGPTLLLSWRKIRDRWFELENRGERSGIQAKHALSTIVGALTQALKLEEPPRFNADYADFEIKLRDDGWRPVSFMSDGWRTYVGAIVGLALRCAALNPWSPDAAEVTPGILVVDELEQHLHPQLQREVVDGLRRAFPKLQLIATTHSPLVVTDVKRSEADRVCRIERVSEAEIRMTELSDPVGCDAEDILTGAWFGLASTLDDDTLELLRKHRELLRLDPEDRAARQEVTDELRRRLHRFAETSEEEFILAIVAELAPNFERLTHDERRALRGRVLARIREALLES